MKLSTLWEAYRQAEAMKQVLHPTLNRFKRKVRQSDKLDKAITRRIVALETAGESAT